MLLNYEEIKTEGLLSDDNPLNYTNASYNLTIGKIINSKGKITNKYTIPPQGMIMVVSKEKFSLKSNIVGYTTVKNKLSISGILAINIGIVDSEYTGPISSILINFGKNDFDIKENDTFMRMTFHKFNPPQNNISLVNENKFINEVHYINQRKQDSMILGNKFLYLKKEIENFKNETVKGIMAYFVKLTIVISIVIAAIAFAYSVFISHSDSDAVKKYQSEKVVIDKLNKMDSSYKQSNADLVKRISILEKQTRTKKQHKKNNVSKKT